jgi:hypothetical protein
MLHLGPLVNTKATQGVLPSPARGIFLRAASNSFPISSVVVDHDFIKARMRFACGASNFVIVVMTPPLVSAPDGCALIHGTNPVSSRPSRAANIRRPSCAMWPKFRRPDCDLG